MTGEWMIEVRPVYDAPDPEDGYRALVDRIWPRGLTKHAAAIDEWAATSPRPQSSATGMGTTPTGSPRSATDTSPSSTTPPTPTHWPISAP
jgi:hypothetical protein